MCLKSFTIKLNHNLVVKICFYVLHPVYSIKVHKTVLNKSSIKYSTQLFQYTSKLHHIPTIPPNITNIPPSSTKFHQYSTNFTNTPAGSTNIPPIVQYHSKFHQFSHSNKLIPATPSQFHQIPVVKEFYTLIYQRIHVRSSNPR